ncbi:MAG: galactokinase [Bacteroidales bacterium]|nr:galactokinase [Bacteroidales bacterium]
MNTELLLQSFNKLYGGTAKDTRIYFSPGRVNLIGEHTDYNGGYVFPCALSFGTYLVMRYNQTDRIRFASGNFDHRSELPLVSLRTKQGTEWTNYPLGVINEYLDKGYDIPGLDFYYYGNIPNGAGLSSSASIEVVTATALNDFLQTHINPVQIALMCQHAENHFVGVNCGIMDQFAVAMGKKDHAVYLDCNTLNYQLVPVVLKGYKLVISNTNKRRGLADSKYNERRGECDQAVADISKVHPIKYLCELSLADFEKLQNNIKNETIRRRARHAVSENQRTGDAVKFLKEGDLLTFGKLMNDSHDSLRYDYEVTGFELDTMVEEARKINGVIGSRMTGAGFGGCTVSLVKEESIEEFTEKVGKQYHARTGLQADFYTAEIGDGAKRLE